MEVPDDLKVYKEWPMETIKEAIDEFRKVLFNGGSIEELNAGIRCFDFLTHGSTIDEVTRGYIDALIAEAEIRMDLYPYEDAVKGILKSQEEEDAAYAEKIKDLSCHLRHMQKFAEQLLPRLARSGEAHLQARFKNHITFDDEVY